MKKKTLEIIIIITAIVVDVLKLVKDKLNGGTKK
jgi:hypothetical protein